MVEHLFNKVEQMINMILIYFNMVKMLLYLITKKEELFYGQ